MRDRAKNDTQHDISKSCGWIWTKFGGQIGYVTRTNRFDFVEYMNPDVGVGMRSTECPSS